MTQPRVRATDDPELARQLGFNRWDEDRAQFVFDEDYDGNDLDEQDDADVEAAADVEDEAVVDYDTWTYADLQAEARRRSLDASGKKDELVARLVANDSVNR